MGYGPTKDCVQGLLDDYELIGIVRKTGECRDGQPLYVFTEFGQKLIDEHPGDDFTDAVDELLRAKRAPH